MELTKEFGDILMEFFIKYDKKHKRKVKKLVAQFSGRENGCLIVLCQRYNIDPGTLDGCLLNEEEKEAYKSKAEHVVAASHDGGHSGESNDSQTADLSGEESSEDQFNSEQTSGGKKKKMLLIILLGIGVLGGLAGGGYFFMGSSGNDTTKINTEVDDASVSDDGEYYEPTAEQTIIADSSEVDSTATNDSTNAESTAVNDSTANQDAIDSSESETDTESVLTE